MRVYSGKIKLFDKEQISVIKELLNDLDFIDVIVQPWKESDGGFILEFFRVIQREKIKYVHYAMKGIYYICPECKEQMYVINNYKCKHCPNCGQKLGWRVCKK